MLELILAELKKLNSQPPVVIINPPSEDPPPMASTFITVTNDSGSKPETINTANIVRIEKRTDNKALIILTSGSNITSTELYVDVIAMLS